MTQIIKTKKELNEIRSTIKAGLAFVPTMGALHEGHLALIKKAKELADTVVVSIFVNPLQFGANEDLSSYPRVLESDHAKLENLKVDYLFAPNTHEIYEDYTQHLERSGSRQVMIERVKANPDLSDRLCGLSRPGHFDGVCTVVKILFDLVKPDIAIFGEKDYQQLQVIKSMVEEYKLPIEIIAYPVVREKSGLAMSSRNQYLSEEELKKASSLYGELEKVKLEILNNGAEDHIEKILQSSSQKLEKEGFKVEYLEIHWNRIFIAARIASTRLIDNISL